MRTLATPTQGCFTASYPAITWQVVPCATAPDRRYAPSVPRSSATARARRANTVGNGVDYSAVVSGSLSSVTGSFPSLSPGATETGQRNGTGPQVANTFSLQLNVAPFTSSICSGSPNSACQGWQQFVYSSTDNVVFIQYWILGYDTTCPTDWYTYESDCYANSEATTLSPGPLTVAELTGVQLTGNLSSGNDTATLLTGSGSASAVESGDPLGLTGNWTTAEYGVFGDGDGTEANFSTNTTLSVETTMNDGETSAPSCALEGFTGETNNLNLSTAPGITLGSQPAMVSGQSNNAGAGAASCGTASAASSNAVLPTTSAPGTSTTQITNYQQVTWVPNDDGTWPCGGGGNASPACPGPDGEEGPTPYALGFPINFYGQSYDSAYVNNNGNLTFDVPLSQYTPSDLSGLGTSIIAPFFADVDTRGAASDVVNFGTGTLDGQKVFVVNWPGVGCYSEVSSSLDDFQLVLIDRPDLGTSADGDDFQIEFNYGSMQWDTGQASGGDANCENDQDYGTAAFVGYSNGTDTDPDTYEFPGSGTANEFLDANSANGLVHGDLNSSVLGRYLLTISPGAETGGIITQLAPLSGTTTATSSASFLDQLNTDDDSAPVTFTTTSPSDEVSVSSSGEVTTTGTLTPGQYTVSGTDGDSLSNAGTWTYTLNVTSTGGGGPGSISQDAPSSATISSASSSGFTDQLATSGQAGAVLFTTSSTTPGLQVSSAGAVSTTGALTDGTYTASGADSDSFGDTGSWTYTLNVEDDPGAPTGATATARVTSISVAFQAPTDGGGATSLTYDVECTPLDGGSAGSNEGAASPIIVTGLTGGDAYTCTVTAVNGIGSGPSDQSNEVVVLSDLRPGTPTSVRALSLAATVHTGSIKVTYGSPAPNGGPAIEHFATSCTSTNGGVARTGTSVSTSITVTGATTGKSYRCKVDATNSVGTGAFSALSAPVIVGAPPAPTSVAASSPSARVLDVTFHAPSTNNGASIGTYTATCTSSNGGAGHSATRAGPLAAPISVGNLTTAKTYTCIVTAANSRGASVTSTPSAPVVPGAPSTPTAVTALSSAAGSVTVSFHGSSADGGAPVTHYTASCTSTNGGTHASKQSSGASTGPITLTGLTTGKAYTCIVSATNVQATSVASLPSPEVVPGAPGAPRNVVGTSTLTATISVTFTAPTSSGGSSILSFIATCTSSNGGVANSQTLAGSTAAPIQVAALTSGKTYTCDVVATNAHGDGPPSAPSAAVIAD